jgi:hypothetical protein
VLRGMIRAATMARWWAGRAWDESAANGAA